MLFNSEYNFRGVKQNTIYVLSGQYLVNSFSFCILSLTPWDLTIIKLHVPVFILILILYT